MTQNPREILQTIQGLIVEFEQVHLDATEIPTINTRNFLKRLRMSWKHGKKIVAPYYVQKFQEIESELSQKQLDADLALKMAQQDKELLKDGRTRCCNCHELISVDSGFVGWKEKKGWFHLGICPGVQSGTK